MATIVNGTDLRFYIGGTAIGEATSCTLSITRETRQTITKDNVAEWTSFEPGQKSATMTAEGLVSYDTTNEKVTDLFTALDNGTVLVCRFTDDTATHPYWEASVLCTSLEIGAPVNDNSTYSATFTVRGAITQGTES